MDYGKTVIIGVNFRDLQKSLSSQHLFAEVVLLDKTHESLQPTLYQLKKEALDGNDDLSMFSKDYAESQKDAFMMIGEVVEIDKKKKMIYLSNDNTVTYTHLIVATGNNSYSESDSNKEFSKGLQTLIDALRIQKVPNFNVQNPYLVRPTPKDTPLFATLGAEVMNMKEIQNIVTHRILQERGQSFSLSLNGVDKRVYEVIV